MVAVYAFNPTSMSQSEANWSVAQRSVAAFAPHAQLTPNLTLTIDPGFLLNGTTLTEVNAQNVGPFSPPTSGFRIDRVVVSRTTGAASVVSGTLNSLTPPAIPPGTLPVARILLQNTTTAITNDLVVDERALTDLSPSQSNPFACRATLNGVNQTGIATGVYTKILFTTTDFNVGGGFDTATSRFKPNVAGYYAVAAHAGMAISAYASMIVTVNKNGVITAHGRYGASNNSIDALATASDVLYLDGVTDYVEATVQHTGSTNILYGTTSYTFFTANRVA